MTENIKNQIVEVINEARDSAKKADEVVEAINQRMDKLEERYSKPPIAGGRAKKSEGPFVNTKSFSEKVSNEQKIDVSMGELIGYVANGRGLNYTLAQKAIGTAPNSSGGYFLTPSISNEVVEEVLAQSVCMKAGARLHIYNAPSVRIPTVVSTSQTSYWKVENEKSDENTITFGAVNHEPKTIMALVKASRESLEDSSLIQQTLVNALYKRMANEIDRVLLRGSGVGAEPTGLRNYANVPVSALSAVISNTAIANAVGVVRAAEFEPNAVVLSHRDFKKYKTAVSTDDEQPLLTLPYLDGIQVYGSGQVPSDVSIGSPATTNCSEMFVGQWDNLVLGVRSDLMLEVSPDAGDAFAAHQVWVKLVGRFSVAVLNPTAFCVKHTVTGS